MIVALIQDMRLVWANCLEYNGKGSKYGKMGDRCSASFEEAWAASGLDSGDRHRRTNAGHAATRFTSFFGFQSSHSQLWRVRLAFPLLVLKSADLSYCCQHGLAHFLDSHSVFIHLDVKCIQC